MLLSGVIGEITSVDFHWYLDTQHGADYFRRWHAFQACSGSLFVHKATHHFDLLNWYLASEPKEIFARGALRHYGTNGPYRGQRCKTCPHADICPYYFDIGRDPDLAAVDVQNRVNQVLGRLPADVRTTGVTVTKNTAGFLGGLGFFTRDNRYTAQFISNYLDLYVRDEIKRIRGAADVRIFGERKYAMRLWLDPVRLAARGLTASDVVAALRDQNAIIAAGTVVIAPMATSAAPITRRRSAGTMP